MKIDRSFDELKRIFRSDGRAEKLISKNYLVDLRAVKVDGIEIGDDHVKCVYHLDGRYSYNLRFDRSDGNRIEFSLSSPSIWYLLPIGILLGLRFAKDQGVWGILLGLALFYSIATAFKSFVRNGVKNRIVERWDSVVSGI